MEIIWLYQLVLWSEFGDSTDVAKDLKAKLINGLSWLCSLVNVTNVGKLKNDACEKSSLVMATALNPRYKSLGLWNVEQKVIVTVRKKELSIGISM